jgi:hypothetical protein
MQGRASHAGPMLFATACTFWYAVPLMLRTTIWRLRPASPTYPRVVSLRSLLNLLIISVGLSLPT